MKKITAHIRILLSVILYTSLLYFVAEDFECHGNENPAPQLIMLLVLGLMVAYTCLTAVIEEVEDEEHRP